MAATANIEPFTMVDSVTKPSTIVSDHYKDFYSGKSSDLNIHLTKAIRRVYPNHTLTIVTKCSEINLLAYAYSSNATAVLDTDTEDVVRWRTWYPGFRGQPDELGSSIRFAKYNYTWLGEKFVMYWVSYEHGTHQYILHECDLDEKITDQSKMVDELLKAIGQWSKLDDKFFYVYDDIWIASRTLYDEIQKSSWDDVILDKAMKTTLTDIVGKFFDSK